MTPQKLNYFLSQEKIDRRLQDDIIKAFYEWLHSNYPEMELELGEYEVDGGNGRTNAAAAIVSSTEGEKCVISCIVYVEKANCFILYNDRMTYMVAMKNNATEAPETFLYPDGCFCSTYQDLVDSFSWMFQQCLNSFYEEHETMDRALYQQIVDLALDEKDYTKLELLDPITKNKLT